MQAIIDKPTGGIYGKKKSADNRQQIEALARSIIDSHSHFYRRAHRFEFCCRENCLIVRGSVPSFYLKQVLQSALLRLADVCQIDNQVSVVSGFGLSSVTQSNN
jgi:hypothetical protein